MAYDANRYLDPALQQLRGRGGFGLGGQTFLGAAPNVRGPAAPAGGTRLGSLPRNLPQWSPVVRMAPGGFRMGGGQERISARPTARNSAEYFAQRDAFSGNPLDNLELGNRDMMREAQRLMMRGQAGTPAQPVAGPTTFNAATGQWEGASATGSQPAPSSFAYGAGASASPGPVSVTGTAGGALTQFDDEAEMARLMADSDRQFRIDRIMGAKNRAKMMGGVADITDSGDVEKTIGGLPADLYWQREANRGMGSNVAPMPGFQGVPYQPTAAGTRYLDRLSGLYRGGVR